MEFWDDFWSIIWWVFAATVFFAYLMALFAVISDLFRDRGMSGWGKAVWLIFLLFFPVLTVLVYLIARGEGMNERAQESAQASRESTEAYIRRVAGGSPSDEISKAKNLLDQGAITPDEFETIKRRVVPA
ncbi:SHOCT domain-containing protein [Arthrobacter sp. zg-ZUI100]|uniref:SHOCT domain-containing protein n=1 Tax=Arthrobacter jiangjiafuii TaxID=2817475 RepID=UPI001AEDF35B|nr:SHOCT domain-containing protein [Arthrobacter jiangjiafuii]MBP3036659.1 SHOCT domain-containing protein [Arthrobacter jiangjiafuii]